jgi:hypothetical protein
MSSTTSESAVAAATDGDGSTPYDCGAGGKITNRVATVDVTAPIGSSP